MYDDDAVSLSDLFCDGKVGCIDADGNIHCSDERIKACILRWLRQPVDGAERTTIDTTGKDYSGLLEE